MALGCLAAICVPGGCRKGALQQHYTTEPGREATIICGKRNVMERGRGAGRVERGRSKQERAYRGNMDSYRRVLLRREPELAWPAPGGVRGCPGEYFRGAGAVCAGRSRVVGLKSACRKCWEAPYQMEELIPIEKRYDEC